MRLTPREQGVFPYYCTTVCGRPHFGMRGVIEVREGNAPLEAGTHGETGRYWLLPPPDAGASVVERGRWLWGC